MPRPPLLALLGAWVPLALLLAAAAPALLLTPWWHGLLAGLAGLYLVPPLLGRLLLLAGRPTGTCALASAMGRRWLVLFLLQSPFLRLPLLEELLRLVPGLYQTWLNLWGSRVSLLSVWGPGVVVSDRWALEIGRGAVIGSGAILSGHLLLADAGGFSLRLGPVRVGAGAVVGGRAGLAPDSTVAAHETFPALQPLPPGRTWAGGRRLASGAAATGEQPAGE